jgi:hypothetical protein
VSLVPRRSFFRRRERAEARARIAVQLEKRFRPRHRKDGVIQIDFSKRSSGRRAKADVVEELDRIDPHWSRVFRLYPTEHDLNRREPR